MTAIGPDIVIAGAGIAGLTAALAFARRDFSVRIFERASVLEEAGAGLQLSPNATSILETLGVLEQLDPFAVAPEAIVLKNAARLKTLASVPLGPAARTRWRAPYLVVHRGDLQKALLARVAEEPGIKLVTGTGVGGADFSGDGVVVSLDRQDAISCRLLIGADGVWSTLGPRVGNGRPSRFSGYVAWRTMIDATAIETAGLGDAVRPEIVTALLDPRFHMVTYPLKGGATINLVAVTKGDKQEKSWSNDADSASLIKAMRNAHPALSRLAGGATWTAWPIFTADGKDAGWTHPGRMALIGDAAHAMTPFAAQGAAMAIEDAAVLAGTVAAMPSDIAGALARYEKLRRPRVARVARRGAFNRFVWHAGGPIAAGRDLVLKLRPEEDLMRDFDWLYGWDVNAVGFAAS